MSVICPLCVPGNLKPPCVRHAPSAFSLPCVLHVSAMRPPKCSHRSRSLTTMCLPRVLHVFAMCPPRAHSLSAQVMCPLKPRPRFWTLSALGLLWREPWFPQEEPFLTIAQPIAFILHARLSISLAFILHMLVYFFLGGLTRKRTNKSHAGIHAYYTIPG